MEIIQEYDLRSNIARAASMPKLMPSPGGLATRMGGVIAAVRARTLGSRSKLRC